MMNITIHGFEDWNPTIADLVDVFSTVQIGANGDCDMSVGMERKSVREWQKDPLVWNKIRVELKP